MQIGRKFAAERARKRLGKSHVDIRIFSAIYLRALLSNDAFKLSRSIEIIIIFIYGLRIFLFK